MIVVYFVEIGLAQFIVTFTSTSKVESISRNEAL